METGFCMDAHECEADEAPGSYFMPHHRSRLYENLPPYHLIVRTPIAALLSLFSSFSCCDRASKWAPSMTM